MSNIVKAPFGAVAGLALLGAVSGCTDSPYEAPQVPVINNPTGFSATLIQKGDFFQSLPGDGAYRLTVPAEVFGGERGTKIPCLLIKDELGTGVAAGLSCDWSQLKPASP